jgi:pyridoxamine 5'-phosphate oxidase
MEKNNPFLLFQQWYQQAQQHEINDPNAMIISTINQAGYPDSRAVLLKDFSLDNAFTFYTNMNSTKANQLIINPKISACLHWKSLRKQVRFIGTATTLPAQCADEYFATRSRKSQIGAWASDQSNILSSRAKLEQRFEFYKNKFSDHENIPRPSHWLGFTIKAHQIEFWQDMPHRLHDRLVFTINDDKIDSYRLYP